MSNKRIGVAWVIALTAFLGSLYFSEMAGFVPCEMCWYQRILMYPLAIIIGIGWYVEDRKLPYYVLPFSIIGACVSTLHYLHQKTEWFSQAVQCTQGVPCSGTYIDWFGFMTIPFLALTAFLSITIIMISILKK